ncbi:hypothetical protein [Thauera butanivorans]|uniref:hypothetical protein n=1 Tax=Thauera butanivorans TaxID=86174 RepID=UPI0008390D52|nr:hypothetical protein [Thauera butanivorans]
MAIGASQRCIGMTQSDAALLLLRQAVGIHAVVIFVTEEKQSSAEQYADRLFGNILDWESPTDHFAQDRMLNAQENGEELHLFHRKRHHTDFTYCGRLKVLSHVLRADRPSHFQFQVL